MSKEQEQLVSIQVELEQTKRQLEHVKREIIHVLCSVDDSPESIESGLNHLRTLVQ